MLLVIIGHTLSSQSEELLVPHFRAIIYSFHMPLFFLLSGYTFRPSVNVNQFKDKIKKSFQSLIGTTLFIFCLRFLFDIVFKRDDSLIIFVVKRIVSLIFSSGTGGTFLRFPVPALGMMWFLVVLFFMRVWVDYLYLRIKNRRLFLALIALTTVFGVIIGQWIYLPFSLDLVFTATSFYLFGHFLKTSNFKVKYPALLCFLGLFISCGIYLFFGNSLEFAARNYPLFPLSYLSALMICLGIIAMAQQLNVHSYFSQYLSFLGRHSLLLFIVHAMDYVIISDLLMTNNSLLNSVLRIILNILCLHLILFIQKLYYKRDRA